MPVRDPWLDNAKMALVTLVVLGHGWFLLPDGVLSDQLYDFLYFWHMPAFVMVTGFLSRGFTWSGPRLWQLVRTVAVPYVVFEAALVLFQTRVGGEQMSQVFLDPHWPVWYLVAFFLWRLATPVLRAVPGAGVLAVGVSLTAGFWATPVLDLYRVLGFLPFFVLGLQATPERLAQLRRPAARAVAVPVLASTLLAARFLDGWAGRDWLYYGHSYADLGATGPEAVVTRVGVLTAGLLAGLAFLALVPSREGWFARLGPATLVVYLFHGFAVRGAEYAGFERWAQAHPLVAPLLVVIASVGLALLLASPVVARRLGAAVDPVGRVEERLRAAHDLAVATAVHEATAPRLRADLARAAAEEPRVPVSAGRRS